MANVVLTRARRDMIVAGAIKHLDEEYSKYNARITALASGLGHFVYNRLVPADLQTKLKDIPSGYVHWAKGVRIAFSSSNSNRIEDIQFGCNLPLNVEKMSGIAIKFSEADRTANDAVDKIFTLMAEQTAIANERLELKTKLEKLMAPCSSLQQLCKVFPTALNLVDEDTRKMYNRRVERGSAPDLTSLLTPDLKVALVKSNMVRQAKG